MGYRLVDFLVFFPLFIIMPVAWRRNLFGCAMLLGRSFFAFLLSMWLFTPLARISFGAIEGVPLPYWQATWFFVLWVVVWALLPFAVFRFTRPVSGNLKFAWSRPGKILSGLLASWFAISALAAFLFMIPEVEGMYLINETSPFFRTERRAERLYSNFTLTKPDTLLTARKEAAAEWVFQRLRRGEIEDLPEADHLSDYFWGRYRNPWATQRYEKRRLELRRAIKEGLSARALEKVPEGED